MIGTDFWNNQELIEIDIKGKLSKLYKEAGIPSKYHFRNMDTDWSTNYSPKGQLSGLAKKKSEAILHFTKQYIQALPALANGGSLRLILKDEVLFVSDVCFDGSKSSGKTFLLSVIAQGAIHSGLSTKYIEWSDFLDRFQSFESRNAHADYFEECLDVDILIIDSIYEYDINNKYFTIQLDRLISHRNNQGKPILFSIDTVNGKNPVFGPVWNKFSRETYTFKLPESSIKK